MGSENETLSLDILNSGMLWRSAKRAMRAQRVLEIPIFGETTIRL
jgi:hypothetical protein